MKDFASVLLRNIDNYYNFLEKWTPIINLRTSSVFTKELLCFSSKIMEVAFRFETYSKFLIRKRIQMVFRRKLARYIYSSKLIRRFYEKPRGYPGDYLMFEMIYNNSPISKGIGYYFDEYVLNHLLIQSVINRKNLMIKLLKGLLASEKIMEADVLNVGCGSCYELRELFDKNRINKHIKLTLLDQDKQALSFAKKHFLNLRNNIKLKFIHANALDILGRTDSVSMSGVELQDVIYSLGVVDYLLDNSLVVFIDRYYRLLKPHGCLIVAACSSRKPSLYTPLRWCCDWNIYARDLKHTIRVIRQELGIRNIDVLWEKNKQVFFLIIRKEG